MGWQISTELSGTTASAVIATLENRRILLKTELGQVEAALKQLKQGREITKVEQGEAKAKHGATYKAVREFLIGSLPYEASVEQIMTAVESSRSTTYRILKELSDTGEIEQTQNGNWIVVTNFIPKPK